MTTAATSLNDHARRLYDEQDTLTRSVNERRNALTPEPVAGRYTFTRTEGTTASLADLFLDHRDLLVIHNMGRRCHYCTMWADAFIGLTRHITRRAALVLASPDEPEVVRAFALERGWTFPCVSTATDDSFTRDMGFQNDDGSTLPGVSAFHRDQDNNITRTGVAAFGPGDVFNPAWHLFPLLAGGAAGFKPE